MKKLIPLILLILAAVSVKTFGQSNTMANPIRQTTFCNPLNLDYRFCLDNPSRREAADPTLVVFRDEYYLFASKSGGYWHSTDLIQWDLITSRDLPLEDYAPTALIMHDSLYFMASADKPVIYKTADPKSGKWARVREFPLGVTDPCLFLDDDSRLYLYYGCSNINPIYGVELDPVTFSPIGTPKALIHSHREQYGWERPGDYNDKAGNPWIEGAWMTKHDGTYYLQYAAPGTEYKSYCDGLYISSHPLGDFHLAPNNPCSSRPVGFVAGAGHSSTFKDRYGNYWHIATMTISQKHMFERRLGLFPMFFNEDGELYTWTGYGDFPMRMPCKKLERLEEFFSRWMLLSYRKPVEVSSELAGHPSAQAVDEDIRTYWSARTGDKGEWISVDLQKECTLHAVQINYAEHETEILGRDAGICHQYLLEYSSDARVWQVLADQREVRDVPHDYLELAIPVKARFVRLTNYRVPGGTFALAGLRLFGDGGGAVPAKVGRLKVDRSPSDRCAVTLKWKADPRATGCTILYGTQKNKLYHACQVLDADSLTIRSLDRSSRYYFTIEPFNENGTGDRSKIVAVD